MCKVVTEVLTNSDSNNPSLAKKTKAIDNNIRDYRNNI